MTTQLYMIWDNQMQGWRQFGGIGFTTDISRAGYWSKIEAHRIAAKENKHLKAGWDLTQVIFPCQILKKG